VNAVIEIDVVGKVVDSRPLNRLACARALSDRLQVRTVRPYLRVAVHAGLRRRNSRRSGSLNRSMTIAAINAVVSGMVLMAELHGLLALRECSCVPRRAINRGEYPEEGEHDKDRSEDTEPCQEISAVMKNLGHRSVRSFVPTFQRTGKSQAEKRC